MKRVRWPLPGRPVEYKSEEELFNEVHQFFVDNLDLQDDREYDLSAAFVLMTWRFEQYQTIPYLLFLGPQESGKSRALECLEAVCYRGWFATHPSVASLHHVMDAYHPTFLLDNFEALPRERRYEIEGILNAGYRRGGKVDRLEPLPEGGFKERWYEVYCPKALATIREPSGPLTSRCVRIGMNKSSRAFPRAIDQDQARELRGKLLSYRFRHLASPPASESDSLNLYGRLGEIFSPLVSVAPSQQVLDRLLNYGDVVRSEREEEDRATFDAEVVRALVNCKEHVTDGRVAIKKITDILNEERSEKEKTKSWHVGRSLTRLGLRKRAMPDKLGSKGVVWDEALVELLAARYGAEQKPSETSRVSSQNRSEQSDGKKEREKNESGLTVLTHLTDSAGVLGASSKPPLGQRIQAGIIWLSDPENLDAEGCALLDEFTAIVGGPETVQHMLRDGLIMSHPSKLNRVRPVRR